MFSPKYMDLFWTLISALHEDLALHIPDLNLPYDFGLDETMSTIKDYGSWTLGQIKAELRKRNAKLTGKKAVLVQRLIDYDLLFGDLVNDPDSAYQIELPAPDKFRDVTSDTIVPLVNEDDLSQYAALIDRENITTSCNMYNENFLLSFRSAYENNEGTYFVTAVCGSEMRKNVNYNIVLKLQDHLIMETQCECAAGMGPHAQCKHVLVAIYGLIDFTKNKIIKTRPTCTDTLQRFHQPNKTYMGNPVTAENLQLKKHDANFKRMMTFDPRPTVENKENFVQNFEQQVINFSGTYKTSVPIAEMRKPANKKAVIHDHDYLEMAEDLVFMKKLELTDVERKNLEEVTKTNKKKWQEERLRRMQSSDFGKICKSKDATKKKLARSLQKKQVLNTLAIKHGFKYEKKAVQMFEEQTGLRTRTCGIIVHDEQQYLGSTPDRLVGEDAVLEVKCPYSCRTEKISPENVDYLHLCEKEGYIKLKESHDYYYQVQGQLYCTKRKFAYFCIYTFEDFIIIKIARDDEFIKKMVEKLKIFFEEYYKKEFLNRYFYKLKY